MRHSPCTGEFASHPAVLAWDRVSPDGAEVIGVSELKLGRKSQVYRLLLAGSPQPLVAKRSRIESSRTERLAYESILPSLGIPSLTYHGSVEEEGEGFGWIFLEDAGDRNDVYDHPDLYASWLAACHENGGLARNLLSYRGPDDYLTHLRNGRERIRRIMEVSREQRSWLDRAVDCCDRIEHQWSEVEQLCNALSPSLVHGDLKGKNLRVREDGGRRTLLVLDWEVAGWGSPVPDLHGLCPESRGDSARRMIEVYCNDRRARRVSPAVIERLSHVGLLLRMLAGIDWASSYSLDQGFRDKPLRQIRLYGERLSHLIPILAEGV